MISDHDVAAELAGLGLDHLDHLATQNMALLLRVRDSLSGDPQATMVAQFLGTIRLLLLRRSSSSGKPLEDWTDAEIIDYARTAGAIGP